MADDKREKQGGLLAVLLAMGLPLLPLLYVLSSGPALWLTVNARLPASWWNFAYYPLTYARDFSPRFHESFQWYLRLWSG